MISRRNLLKAAALPAVLGPVNVMRGATSSVEDPLTYVNIMIGTGGHGHTYPGATVPFGMVQLSPDTYNVGWDRCSGYHISDSSIMGFSHTHLSGTGASDMLDVLLMPGVGEIKLDPGTPDAPGGGYRSRFNRGTEHTQPGYYAVFLDDPKISVQLTATERAGLSEHTFPRSDQSHFIIDLVHQFLDQPTDKSAVIAAGLNIAGPDLITGWRTMNKWAKGRHIYFAMRFSKPFGGAELYSDNQRVGGDARTASGKALKCAVRYKTNAGDIIAVKVGLSGVSIDGAMKNLDKEIPGWDFTTVRRAARDAWTRELSKIAIEGSDHDQKTIFYTSLYHCMLAPTLFDDVDGQYRGMDDKIHQLPQGSHNYSTYSLWDTYRALHPLFTLIQAPRVADFVNCLIRMANESPAGMPVWPLQGEETGCMTGYHSAVVIAEAAAKGFRGIDLAAVYPPMIKRAMTDNYRGLGLYRQYGYIPCDKEEESATKTMEYAYDDWAVAHVAHALGHEDDHKNLVARSENYKNLFDKSVGFIRPRLANGQWATPFDPKRTSTSKRWRDFTESNSWQGTWAAQHAIAGYFPLFGGRDKFVEKLDALFVQSTDVDGEVPVDMTGLVGMYAQGNEPSHHIAYLYAYAGAPYKTQSRVRDLLTTMYRNDPDGLAGNEDCGQMSAWYVISALGFYAVDPVSGNYVLGSPLFDKAVVDVGGGKKLVIEARGQAPENKYINSVALNGKDYGKPWFRHADVSGGATLVFTMARDPNKSFGAAESDAPPSLA